MSRFFLTVLFPLFLFSPFSYSQDGKEDSVQIIVELTETDIIRHAGIVVAKERGLFDRAGIDVTLKIGGAESEIKQNIAKGITHFSTAGAGIIEDAGNGLPLTVVTAFFQRTPNMLLYYKDSTETPRFEHIDQSHIILNSESSVEMLAMLNSAKKTFNSLKISYGTEDKEKKFLDKSVKGIEVNVLSRFYRDIQEMEGLHALKPIFSNVEMYDNCLYTNTAFLNKNRDLVKKFKDICLQGWKLALENSDFTGEKLGFKKEDNSTWSLFHHQLWHIKNSLMMPNLVTPGDMSRDKWSRIEELYKKYGSLNADFDGKFYTLFDEIALTEPVSPINWKYLISILGIISLAVVALFILNRRLKRMVDRRTMEIAEVNWQLNKLNDELEDKINDRTRELESALKKAEVANKAKSTFLANMTHEIRTPMNSILGFTQIMKEKSKDPDILRYLDTINTSGQSLLRIINDVLDLSRVEAGKFSLDFTRFNILRLIEETMATFSQDILGKKVSFRFDHSDECPEYVYLDKDRLRQVLMNLIGNAVKFTEEGLIEVKLSVKMVSPRDADIVIEVKDTGIGIPKENISSIFGEFEQVENIHMHYGGTGLGLAIAKQLVEMMNGKLSVESDLGRGSDFKIKLYNVGIVDHVDEHDNDKKLQYFFEPSKVMVVDECQLTLDLFEAYLSVTRLTVRKYKSPFAAVKDLEEFDPDLIITEISLREMDGFKFAEEIRSNAAYKSIPIIAISSISHTGSRQKFRIFNGFLKKPISVDEFYYSISHFLPCKKVDKKQPVKEANLEHRPGKSAEFDFRSLISKETREKCINAMKFQVINDYKEIYSILNSLATDMNCKPLKTWLEEFRNNLDVFNFEALNRQLQYLMNTREKTKS